MTLNCEMLHYSTVQSNAYKIQSHVCFVKSYQLLFTFRFYVTITIPRAYFLQLISLK